MFNKKIMMIFVILVSLLAISAVSATDNMDENVSTVNESINSMEPLANDDGQNEKTLTMDDNSDCYGGDEEIQANLEMIDYPKDYGENQITFKLTNAADNSPLANIELGILSYIPDKEVSTSKDDKLGAELNSKPLTFMAEISNFTMIKTNSNGIAIFTIPEIFTEDFKIMVGFYIDDGISSNTETVINGQTKSLSLDFFEANITSPVAKASIKLSKEGSYFSDVVLKVSLISNNNKAIPNETIQITFSNGKKVKISTNSKGIATYKIPFDVGTYSATANVVSKKVISNSTTLNNIAISKTPVSIKPTKLSAAYASGKYFQIKVINTKTNDVVSNVKLALKVYTGKKYKPVTVTTNSKGIAKYSISSLGIGSHKVVASINTKNCAGSSKTSSIKITKSKVSISAPTQYVVFKKGPAFKVKVVNKESKKAVKGIAVTAKFYTGKNYKTMTAKTNSKGEASFSTKGLSKGKHTVKISTKANANYLSGSAKSSTNVLASKISTYFIVQQGIRFIVADSGVTFTTAIVFLRDVKGNNLVKPIKVSSPSHGTTTEKSDSSIPIQLTYSQTFTFSFAGDAIYKPASKTFYMTVS